METIRFCCTFFGGIVAGSSNLVASGSSLLSCLFAEQTLNDSLKGSDTDKTFQLLPS